jgi:CBS domain-containing protein
MKGNVRTCTPADSLQVPAQIMWEQDCGSVPVIADDGKLVGMITDRDICMAAYLRHQPLHECAVADVMSRPAVASRPSDPVEKAETTMREKRIRRLPVIEADGHLVGILSLNDIILASRHGQRSRDLAPEAVVSTMAAICQHRTPPAV